MITSVAVLGTGMRWACARDFARGRAGLARMLSGPKQARMQLRVAFRFRMGRGSLTVSCTVPVTVPWYDL